MGKCIDQNFEDLRRTVTLHSGKFGEYFPLYWCCIDYFEGNLDAAVLLCYLINLYKYKCDREEERLIKNQLWIKLPVRSIVKTLWSSKHKVRESIKVLKEKDLLEIDNRSHYQQWIRLTNKGLLDIEAFQTDRRRKKIAERKARMQASKKLTLDSGEKRVKRQKIERLKTSSVKKLNAPRARVSNKIEHIKEKTLCRPTRSARGDGDSSRPTDFLKAEEKKDCHIASRNGTPSDGEATFDNAFEMKGNRHVASRADLSPSSLASMLYEGLSKKRLIMRQPSLGKWSREFESLLEEIMSRDSIDKCSGLRHLKSVLSWYIDHVRDEYMSQAYSAKAFHEKFISIEAARNRYRKNVEKGKVQSDYRERIVREKQKDGTTLTKVVREKVEAEPEYREKLVRTKLPNGMTETKVVRERIR